MRRMHTRLFVAILLVCSASPARAQQVPAPYQPVLTALGKKGDFKDGVLKVNIPRSDLSVTIGGRPAPTPFGFGGWVAMAPVQPGGAAAGPHVMMGDLVLTEADVNPVMSALLDNGLEVTALHTHFFHEQPRVFYMHVHGLGTPEDLARRLKPAVALIDAAAKNAADHIDQGFGWALVLTLFGLGGLSVAGSLRIR
jgi:hypothetical protein